MAINTNRIFPIQGIRAPARLAAISLFVLSAGLAAAPTFAASSDAEARYRAERAECNSGQSAEDRATCLREAGAAWQAARQGRLEDNQASYRENALIRCNALPAQDRDACHHRIEGEGTTSGSVREGALVRELVVPDNK